MIDIKDKNVIWFRKYVQNRAFYLDGRRHRYFFHDYNGAWFNERTVEIPIAQNALKEARGEDVLEVGNVLPYYGDYRHDVVDKYEHGPNVKTVDILDYHPDRRYGLILCISTLEHIGWDEQVSLGVKLRLDEENKIKEAVDKLRSLRKPGGLMLITVPIGYNPIMDSIIKEELIDFTRISFLKRVTSNNTWVQVDKDVALSVKYGEPFPLANAVAIIFDE